MFENTIKHIKNLESTPLEKLRILVENIADLKEKFSTKEEDLKKFLYARRLSVSDSFNLIKNYVNYRRDNPSLFENLSIGDKDIRAALENSLPGLLPHKDRKCRAIFVFHANNWDGTYSLTTIYRAFLLCLDYALQDVHTQNNGFVVIVNWEQFTFRKSTWINPRIIRSMIYGLQECYPAKFLEIHFIASPWYINTAFNVYKLSFSEETRENFWIHGRNLSALHDFIHKDVLPTELGGSKPSYNSAELIEELENFCEMPDY